MYFPWLEDFSQIKKRFRLIQKYFDQISSVEIEQVQQTKSPLSPGCNFLTLLYLGIFARRKT